MNSGGTGGAQKPHTSGMQGNSTMSDSTSHGNGSILRKTLPNQKNGFNSSHSVTSGIANSGEKTKKFNNLSSTKNKCFSTSNSGAGIQPSDQQSVE